MAVLAANQQFCYYLNIISILFIVYADKYNVKAFFNVIQKGANLFMSLFPRHHPLFNPALRSCSNDDSHTLAAEK